MQNNKNDDKASMIKDALILFAITLISGLLLGFVYQLTKDPIAQQEKKAIDKACSQVFENAAGFEEITYTPSETVNAYLSDNGVTVGKVFKAMAQDQSKLGYVLECTSSRGYGGNITIYIGITNEGSLNGISILKISETPGLGMRAEEVLVPQFKNKDVTSFTYTKTGSTDSSQIDAISGATITTKAVTGAVNAGLFVMQQDLKEN